jgi:acyl-CoA synthetase (AMP-forming)/AMP-acid ligase II
MIVPLTPIRCLYRGVDLYGKKVGVVSGESRYTYAQFGERCERLAAGLLAQGVERGDRVAYLSFNNNQLLEGYYAAPLIRAIVMPLNVRLTAQELIQILNHSSARVLVFENDFAPLIDAFRKMCPSIERYVAIDSKIPQADLTFEELLGMGRIDRPDLFSFDENEIAELFYTSGSTGTPKGVMLSHRTLYLHALGVTCSITQDDNFVELHTIPLFHANGWGRPQTAALNGIKQVMVRRFDPACVLRLIQEERATGMSLVPVMANALLCCPELGKFDVSSMKEIHLGGAAASVELVARLEKAFRCHVMAGYGLTETCPVATSSGDKNTVHYANEEDRLHHKAMAGWPIVGNEIHVVDSKMCDVPRDMETIGEVVIRGDNVMDGYYREPEATKEAITNGWLHTGDMAVWDEENYVHIVDRKKDIIISGGENISSIEIEKAIFAHPAVFECAVVAAPDPRWGEIPVALVVRKPGQELNEAELCEFLHTRIAKFKLPKQVKFVEGPLPKTGTGKILKRELREQFWQGHERRVQ